MQSRSNVAVLFACACGAPVAPAGVLTTTAHPGGGLGGDAPAGGASTAATAPRVASAPAEPTMLRFLALVENIDASLRPGASLARRDRTPSVRVGQHAHGLRGREGWADGPAPAFRRIEPLDWCSCRHWQGGQAGSPLPAGATVWDGASQASWVLPRPRLGKGPDSHCCPCELGCLCVSGRIGSWVARLASGSRAFGRRW
jgi:hypothetical protein